MWARVSTYRGQPEAIDEDFEYVRDNILPKARQMPGFRGVLGLGDRATGRTMSITLWDSEQDMRASEADADRLRGESTDHTGGTTVGVERFEVMVDERS